jgi:hypothetical protein
MGGEQDTNVGTAKKEIAHLALVRLLPQNCAPDSGDRRDRYVHERDLRKASAIRTGPATHASGAPRRRER